MLGERRGLLDSPAVTSNSLGVGVGDSSLDHQQPTTGSENAPSLAQRLVDVGPVMHCRQRPHNVCPTVVDGDRLCRTDPPINALSRSPTRTSDAQHHRSRIDTDHFGTNRSRMLHGDTGPTADIDQPFARLQFRELNRQFGGIVASEEKADGRDQATEA